MEDISAAMTKGSVAVIDLLLVDTVHAHKAIHNFRHVQESENNGNSVCTSLKVDYTYIGENVPGHALEIAFLLPVRL